jgi:RND family efflux transporter MFP subunit
MLTAILRPAGSLLLGSIVATAAASAVAAEKFECLVEPYLDVSVSSAVPGILDEVRVDRGSVVKKGQVLASLASDVTQARRALIAARAEFAERQVERNQELFRKQVISPHEKDELETNALLLKLELREVEEALEQRTILSPVDGVVVERMFSPGEYVNEDPILRLAQVNPLRVEVAVPASMWGRIQVGGAGQVTWEAPVEGVYTGRVTVVDPVVDAASGTLGIRLELPNPAGRLPAGTKCWVDFPEP